MDPNADLNKLHARQSRPSITALLGPLGKRGEIVLPSIPSALTTFPIGSNSVSNALRWRELLVIRRQTPGKDVSGLGTNLAVEFTSDKL